MNQTCTGWSNKQVNSLYKYKNKLYEAEQKLIVDKIYNRQSNQISFYQITPKEDLPKCLQKMSFQTINTKQMNIGSLVKVNKKQKLTKKQFKIRKLMKQNGQIMLLSQIYNYLDDSLQPIKTKQKSVQNQVMREMAPLSNIVNQLDQWEKVISKRGSLQARFSLLKPTNSTTQQRRSSSHKKQFIVKKFKIGSNYKAQVQKNLQIINCSHKNQQNLMTKFSLIQNSSKLLKKQLQQMKEIVQKQIQEKMKKLTQSRKQHHRLYEEKLKLQIQQQELDQQMAKQQVSAVQSNGFSYHTLNQNNIKSAFEEKRNQIQKNQVKINKIRKNIQFLQEQALKNQQQLKNIILAQMTYYKISLKNGTDSRDSGLVWIIKKLGLQQADIPNIQFPNYLDKKSKYYLVFKAQNQENLQELLNQKRIFVKEIGKENSQQNNQRRSSIRCRSRKSSIKCVPKPEQIDSIRQSVPNQQNQLQIPKRYSRSMRKISALREQFLKNQNLFKLTQSRQGIKFGYDLKGLTGRQIYHTIGQKIKQVDFTKLKKQKAQEKNDKIFLYQGILRKIQDLHMLIEQQDIQHQNHLLTQYKDNKQLFFNLAAACFGVKRAYSLIIKNFSWKNTI